MAVSTPSDPICSICSKPVRSGSLVLYQGGEFFHVPCRSRATDLKAMEEVERARNAQGRALRLVDDTKRRRALHDPTDRPPGSWPLCSQPATVTDWRPDLDWITVEGCSCGGYFLADGVLRRRVPAMSEAARAELTARIQEVRVSGHEAWLTTSDGGLNGPLIVQPGRPDRPM